jgi:hypothetical protein
MKTAFPDASFLVLLKQGSRDPAEAGKNQNKKEDKK